MARAKGSPVKRPNKKSSWGGRRRGAGRKRKLEISDRRQIAKEYFVLMQNREQSNPRRESVISELMEQFGVTHRVVERAIEEFLPELRIWSYATEGMNEVHPLLARKIDKLKPGVYADDKLRLIVDSGGNRVWIFRFIWRGTVRDMVLGGSEMSPAMARERATKASRMIAAGQNPIDGSWSSAALQSLADLQRAKSKT